MRPQDLIRIVRDNEEMPTEEIRSFIAEVSDGTVPDYQVAALLMAIFWRGMTETELSAWTDAMLNSGRVLDLSPIPGRKEKSSRSVSHPVTIVNNRHNSNTGTYLP